MYRDYNIEYKFRKVYSDLTNVNLDKISYIDGARENGYRGEYLVFKKLFFNINGNEKYLMNLQIPTINGKKTEVDLIMIHETGIYVFEIKHYKGIIYGKYEDEYWTQYFKTTRNYIFKNPILQNDYHINYLKKILPNVPFYNIVVFSNDECDIRINNNTSNVIISDLNSLKTKLLYFLKYNKKIYNLEQIDNIFNRLSIYSPMREQKIILDVNSNISFYDYAQYMKKKIMDLDKEYIKEMNEKRKELNQLKENYNIMLKKEKIQLESKYEEKISELKLKQFQLNFSFIIIILLLTLIILL